MNRSEQERSGVWLVAPLISKLSSQVQGRVLRAAGNVLESVGQTWSKSSKDKDKHGQKTSVLEMFPSNWMLAYALKNPTTGYYHSIRKSSFKKEMQFPNGLLNIFPELSFTVR